MLMHRYVPSAFPVGAATVTVFVASVLRAKSGLILTRRRLKRRRRLGFEAMNGYRCARLIDISGEMSSFGAEGTLTALQAERLALLARFARSEMLLLNRPCWLGSVLRPDPTPPAC